MDSVGMHSLSSAAAQGGQTTSSEHASGSVFTGWGTDVQTPQDASHQGGILSSVFCANVFIPRVYIELYHDTLEASCGARVATADSRLSIRVRVPITALCYDYACMATAMV